MSDWIAVVDDDRTILGLASRILGAKNMRVSCLKSGVELLEFLEENHPDLILLDILMPDMDGLETIAVIKSRPQIASIPVIFLTADDNSETETRGLLAGAMDFIKKPFVPEVLILRVRHTLDLIRLRSDLEHEVEKKTAEVMAQHERIRGLKKAAETDQMTGLLNKQSAQEEIGALCRRTQGVLMMIDLDSFKLVNDLYGHSIGDKVLIQVAQIIRSAIRSTDIAGRVGGDEFVAFCQHVREESVIGEKAKYINEKLLEYAHELLGENLTIPLGVSIGAVMAPDEGTDFLSLYQKADEALYTVKQNGKHGYTFFWEAKRPEEDSSGQDRFVAMSVLRERNRKDGGMYLPFEQFRLIFRFLVRVELNYPFESRFLLFTISSEEASEEQLGERAELFAEVARKSLRVSDVVTRNGTNQCMVLLLDTDQGESERVVERIIRHWNESGDYSGFRLSYETEWIQ